MGFARWFRLGLGLLLVVAALWVLLSRLDVIWNGHPAYPTTLLIAVGAGLTLIAFAFLPWRLEQEPDGPPWEVDNAVPGATPAPISTPAPTPAPPPPPTPAPKPVRRRRRWRVAGRVVVTILVVGLVGVLAWLRPFPAGPDAIAAMSSDNAVTVTDNPTTIVLTPRVLATPTVGLVFSPGARVDSRAYVDLLRPAAAAGSLVVILKEPYGLAIIQPGQSGGPIADHPEIATWAVGGHSLGGTAAALFAGDNLNFVKGLLLWASYPSNDLSTASALQVLSISGSNDLLATPADIEASKNKLPPQTTFVQIDGGVHAFFGDYGEQPGDGQPEIDRATASAQISAATAKFLRGLP
ncbi:MAG: alpha/beta hydrolase [Nakamurella sp.]